MNRPLSGLPSHADALAVSHTAFDPAPASRAPSLMRKYEVTALLPDLSISHTSLIAPATALFEESCSAFANGTPIDTIRGAVAVEDLLPGDYVETDATPEPIVWIGSTTYVPNRTDDQTILRGLTRITNDSFGIGRPAGDILIGPAARMVLRRDRLEQLIGQRTVLVPVADFADGDRILDIMPTGPVQLFHIMLRRQALIRVGGIEMETYHPGKSATRAMAPSTRTQFLSLFPDITDVHDFGELTWPRTRLDVIDSLIAG